MIAAAAKLLQSCPTLCDPIDGNPSGSPVPGILQARTLEWVAISFSNAWKEKWKWSHSLVSDSSDPMDLSLPGSSVHGIFQVSKAILFLLSCFYIVTLIFNIFLILKYSIGKISGEKYTIKQLSTLEYSAEHAGVFFCFLVFFGFKDLVCKIYS